MMVERLFSWKSMAVGRTKIIIKIALASSPPAKASTPSFSPKAWGMFIRLISPLISSASMTVVLSIKHINMTCDISF